MKCNYMSRNYRNVTEPENNIGAPKMQNNFIAIKLAIFPKEKNQLRTFLYCYL